MDHPVGIDVSLEQSSVCVVDAGGGIIQEAKVASEPDALVHFLQDLALPLARVPGLRQGRLLRSVFTTIAESAALTRCV